MRVVKDQLSIHRIIDNVFHRIRLPADERGRAPVRYVAELRDGQVHVRVKVTGKVVKVKVDGLLSPGQVEDLRRYCRTIEEVSSYVHRYLDRYRVDLHVAEVSALEEYFESGGDLPPIARLFLAVSDDEEKI